MSKEKIRPPGHSANQPEIVSANASERNALRSQGEAGLEDVYRAPDPNASQLVAGAISANEDAGQQLPPVPPGARDPRDWSSVTLSPEQAASAREQHHAPNRLGNPQVYAPNEQERALLEFNAAKQALRDDYARSPNRQSSPAAEERYERAKETMVQLGLMK